MSSILRILTVLAAVAAVAVAVITAIGMAAEEKEVRKRGGIIYHERVAGIQYVMVRILVSSLSQAVQLFLLPCTARDKDLD
jgi:hypothetical protein